MTTNISETSIDGQSSIPSTNEKSSHLAFLDWMKFLGMALIVWGHTGGEALIDPTRLFNAKQLGVAFFVFALGFTLARETRPRWQVCFNRIFPVVLVGFVIAVIISVISYCLTGNIRESDFLPFMLGANVLFDFFPANPTTWYIGTYIHIILLWGVLLSRIKISLPMLLICLPVEILLRAVLMNYAGNFIAYTLITNWITALMLGMYIGQFQQTKPKFAYSGFIYGIALIAILTAWTLLIRDEWLLEGFPFQRFNLSNETVALLLSSTAISALYLIVTWFVYLITKELGQLSFVQFLARNTLFVFIVHMPLVYALAPIYYPYVPYPIVRAPINQLLFFLLPALASELLFRLIPLKRIRDWLYQKILKILAPTRP
ncbi:MAG: hypothetical protein COA78_35660 [Blastopirellula sp.]|nr:MAG: hypothetical protein COA78_35660 [Blastopirellula sp.]